MTTSEVEKKTDLVTLTIDGVQVSVPAGTLVIRAAEQVGVQIPRFCDHPLLEPVGACRQCLVDVPDAGNGRPIPKPQASCTIPVAEGMVVNTQATSEVADKAQQGIMEFLLVNHPLDCPVCDKGGECPLQNQAMSNGRGESRFAASGGVKRTFPKPINISAQVLLDRERCVLCARCTRFSEQVAGDPFIELLERGALQQVGIYEKEPFESYFSGNTIQICPVGALTSADYRFRSRPFDLVSTPSVAEHDACGAAIRVDHRRGQVMRRLSGNDPEVNEEWITDKDRFAFGYLHADDRITYPRIREDGELRPASWPEAFAVAARGPGRGRRDRRPAGWPAHRRGRVRLQHLRPGRARHQRHRLPGAARTRRRRPTSSLPRWCCARVRRTPTSRPPTPSLLVGLEPEDEAGTIFLRLRKANRHHRTRVWSVAPFATNGLRKMGGTLIAARPGAEAEVRRRAGPRRRRRARQHQRDPGRRADGDRARRAHRGRPPRPHHRRQAGLGAASRRRPRCGRDRLPAEPAARRSPGHRRLRPRRRGHRLGRRRAARPARVATRDAIVAARRRPASSAVWSSAASTPTTRPTPRRSVPPSRRPASWSPSSSARPT